jgi:hypothetical protein
MVIFIYMFLFGVGLLRRPRAIRLERSTRGTFGGNEPYFGRSRPVKADLAPGRSAQAV